MTRIRTAAILHDEPDSDISDQEPSIFADDDIDTDFDPGEFSRSNIVTDNFGRDSPADNSSDIVINSSRPETSRRRLDYAANPARNK